MQEVFTFINVNMCLDRLDLVYCFSCVSVSRCLSGRGRCCRGWQSSVPGRRDSVQPDTYCPAWTALLPRWCLSSPTRSAAPGVMMNVLGHTTTDCQFTIACTETSGGYILSSTNELTAAAVTSSLFQCPNIRRISVFLWSKNLIHQWSHRLTQWLWSLSNRTNLPKEVMMFPDYPFDPKLNSFLPHQEVQRYLEGYCQSYNILPHIRVSRPAVDHCYCF